MTDDEASRSERANLVRLIEASGGTAEDIADASTINQLRRLAVELLFFRSRPRYTVDEAATRAGVPAGDVVALRRAVGLPPIPPDERQLNDDDVQLVRTVAAASEFFGPAATMQLLRVVGAAMARIADAAVSTFVTTASTDGGAPDNVVANQTAAAMMPQLLDAMDTILRHHVVHASRPAATRVQDGFESTTLAVAFVDLVGSSQLARLAPLGEVGVAVAEFERRTADIVTDHGGRVVKFIGDEAMFVVTDASTVCDVALTILGVLAADPTLPPARAGAGYGEVLIRDADVFGPVVNLAARATKAARPGCLVVADDVKGLVEGHHFTFELLAPIELKGFDPTPLYEVRRAPA